MALHYFGINCTSLKDIGDGATSEAIALPLFDSSLEGTTVLWSMYVVEQLQLRLATGLGKWALLAIMKGRITLFVICYNNYRLVYIKAYSYVYQVEQNLCVFFSRRDSWLTIVF